MVARAVFRGVVQGGCSVREKKTPGRKIRRAFAEAGAQAASLTKNIAETC
jgi:hypothetical protein